jgi:NAD-dependent dihydropyrimidine dehydrogenase PreA subunit
VAETIATGLNDSLIFIPDAAREGRYEYELDKGESLGFVFPIYAWGPPKLVLDFIEKLKVPEPVEGPTYIYFACTCGDECGLAEDIFRKAMEQKGWKLDACISLQMPETFIGMPGFKLDTDENAKRKISAVDVTLAEYIPRIQNKESFSKMTKGGAAWFKSRLINPGFSKMATNDKKYYTTDACIHCGKCVEACPLKNITLEDGHPKWNGNCTMCMSCYHHCPVNAIQYGKATVGKGQYYFGRR